MIDSPELAGQKLLDMLPDDCMLETSVRDTGKGWEATACVLNPFDSPKPEYLGKGATEDEALLRAIDHCAAYWHRREHNSGCNGR